MINERLKQAFPFVSNYFETLIKTDINKFPQSIVFEGLDTFGQFFFSMELARILNCEKDGSFECTCRNCRWIKENTHPCATVVSPVDFKSDSSKTVISVEQTKKITGIIRQTSEYHRFFIFTNAKKEIRTQNEETMLQNYLKSGFSLKENDWTPVPLTSKVFKADASNSVLKSVEEPPEKTTFIFLTKSKDDIINTIVSRSNVFKLSSNKIQNNIKEKDIIFNNYPDITLKDALDASLRIQDKIKNELINPIDLLDEYQSFLMELLKKNLKNNALYLLIQKHIKLMQKAKLRLNASMSIKVVFDSLFMDISNNRDDDE